MTAAEPVPHGTVLTCTQCAEGLRLEPIGSLGVPQLMDFLGLHHHNPTTLVVSEPPNIT